MWKIDRWIDRRRLAVGAKIVICRAAVGFIQLTTNFSDKLQGKSSVDGFIGMVVEWLEKVTEEQYKQALLCRSGRLFFGGLLY